MLRFLINQRRYHKNHSINQVAMMANSEKISDLKYYLYCTFNMNYSKIYLLQLYTLCVCGTVDIYKYDAKTVDASQSILLRCVCIYDFI